MVIMLIGYRFGGNTAHPAIAKPNRSSLKLTFVGNLTCMFLGVPFLIYLVRFLEEAAKCYSRFRACVFQEFSQSFRIPFWSSSLLFPRRFLGRLGSRFGAIGLHSVTPKNNRKVSCECTRVFAALGGGWPYTYTNIYPGGRFSTSVHSSGA